MSHKSKKYYVSKYDKAANRKKRSILPLWATGFFAGMWVVICGIPSVLSLGLLAGTSALVFGFTSLCVANPMKEFPELEVKKEEAPVLPEPKEAAPITGDKALDKMINDKDAAVRELNRLNDAIIDEEISAKIDHLVDIISKIVDYITVHPDKRRLVDRMFSYYLPTTIKLLDAYSRMDEAGISGMNIDGTMGKVEVMLDTVVQAFDRQLDALYGDEALDISTDITVMENVMKSEGLLNDESEFTNQYNINLKIGE